MADIINLRRARKAKAREKAAQQAAENRAVFGRPKAEKLKAEAEAARLNRHLDQSRRADGDKDGPDDA